MIKISYDEIVSKIEKKTGLSKKDIEGKVTKKMSELANMVSKEGAAHIVANSLDVKLVPGLSKERLELQNVVSGLRNVVVYGRVSRVFNINTFERNGETRKVGSFLLYDGTGSLRIVLWNNKIGLMEEGKITNNVLLKITNLQVKESNIGRLEAHANNMTRIIIDPEDVDASKFPEVGENPTSKKKNILDLEENEENAKVLGTIVGVFPPRFYDTCTKCKKSVKNESGVYVCREHGEIQDPNKSMILNLTIDDGTSFIRVVIFGNQGENIYGKPAKEAFDLQEDPDFQNLFEQIKSSIIGKELLVFGKIQKNDYTQELEIVANRISREPNPIYEVYPLMEGLMS